MHKDINAMTKYLFNRTYGAKITDDEEDEILDQVDQQIAEFGWNNTYASWYRYLIDNCKTSESAVNFANLFWWYGGQDHPIQSPHQFLGYLYYLAGFSTKNHETADILDSLATNILPKAGYQEANLELNPNYVPENDSKIVAAAESFKVM